MLNPCHPRIRITISEVTRYHTRRQYMPLLLLGDESPSMIARYLYDGRLFIATRSGHNRAIAVILTINRPDGAIEIKNLAVAPHMRRRGIGRAMLSHIAALYPDRTLTLGTGATPSTLRFYRSSGFTEAYVIPDFFTLNYDHPIIEEGVTLRHMIYLTRSPLNNGGDTQVLDLQ